MSLRLNGQFLLVGAIGSILWSLFVFLIPGPLGITGPNSIPTSTVAVLSGLLLLVGLPALYRVQAQQMGRTGLVGVIFLWIATVLVQLVLAGIQLLDVAVPGSIPHPAGGHGAPPLAIIPAILGGLLLLIGGVIVGIKTIRANVFRAAMGWAILITSLLVLPTLPVGGALGVILVNSAAALFYASLAWAGAAFSFQALPTQIAVTHAQRS